MAEQKYDFIVVGSGPAGSSLAITLATAPKRPSVLLLEAGGDNADHDLRVNGQRFSTLTREGMNWGYKTTPQPECNNREIDYSRGKGLGGSSAINFSVWSVGARDDYEEWARLTGDDDFGWTSMQKRFKKLENFDSTVPEGIDSKFAKPDIQNHGTGGDGLKTGYAREWEKDLTETLDIFEQGGWKLNPDHNSGDPLGMSVVINSAHNGIRSTANDLLKNKPSNLTILTSMPVHKVLFTPDHPTAKIVGVQTLSPNPKTYFANNEVILSAGSLDTPKILMHSGLGPASQVAQFLIPVVHDLPGVGQGLRDHMLASLIYKRTPTSTSWSEFYGSQSAMASALEAWKKDGTGAWAKYACELGIGWKKLDHLPATPEFLALPQSEQEFLSKPTIPHYEVATHFPIHFLIPGWPAENMSYSTATCFYYNAQSRGEVTLQSADPNVPLLFNPRFLEHEFDRRVAVDALREMLGVLHQTSYAKDTVAQIAGPKEKEGFEGKGVYEDDELLRYWRENVISSWHPCGTVKMGDVVDNQFRVVGVEGLRVVDMSVVPLLPSCHVQSVAYLTGLTAGEKMIREYGLA